MEPMFLCLKREKTFQTLTNIALFFFMCFSSFFYFIFYFSNLHLFATFSRISCLSYCYSLFSSFNSLIIFCWQESSISRYWLHTIFLMWYFLKGLNIIWLIDMSGLHTFIGLNTCKVDCPLEQLYSPPFSLHLYSYHSSPLIPSRYTTQV